MECFDPKLNPEAAQTAKIGQKKPTPKTAGLN